MSSMGGGGGGGSKIKTGHKQSSYNKQQQE